MTIESDDRDQGAEHTFSVTHHHRPPGGEGFTRSVGAGELLPDDAHAFIADRLAGPPYRFGGGADAPGKDTDSETSTPADAGAARRGTKSAHRK